MKNKNATLNKGNLPIYYCSKFWSNLIQHGLTVVQHNLLKNDTEAVLNLLTRFNNLSRMAVKHTTLKYIRVLEELEFLQGYVSLIADSSSNEFKVELYLNDGLDPDMLLIPPMLIHHCVDLQIENRFSKHFSTGSLELHFYKIDDETVGCDIIDKNPEAHAFKEKHLKSGEKETLALLDRVRKDIFNNYEGEYNIEVDYIHSPNGEPMGTKTILSFPLLLDH